MGNPADISLATARLSDPADEAADAEKQRYRGLGDDVQDGLGAEFIQQE